MQAWLEKNVQQKFCMQKSKKNKGNLGQENEKPEFMLKLAISTEK